MHSNIRNRLFSLLLTFAMLFALFPTSALATEDGATAELTDPVGIEFSNASSPYSGNYFISTKESLEALSTAVNSGNTMQGIKFYLQNDIILNDGHFSAKEGSLYYTPDQSDAAYQVSIENATYGDSEQLTAFVPIGFQAKTGDAQWEKNGFAGEFYGNNHEIKGLFVNGNHANAEAHYKGLFGALLTGGNISDLAVSGCVYGAGSNSGGIVGKSWGCIDNCHFSGVVMGAYNAGGIVGETASTGAANTLQNCTNTAHISEGSTATNGGNWGGIAGCANGVSIQNCINYGAVASSKYANVGGIIGVGNADISACINWGSITGPEGRTTNGGVAGSHNNGTTEQNFICITTTDELTKYTRTTCPNHAKWAVALYLNDGSFDGGIVVSSGALATPTKENQIFDGWYVNSDLSGASATTLETGKIYYAKYIPDSGSCGAEGNEENVTWKLEQNNDDANNPTYTITFAGTGGMADYDPDAQPWFAVKNSITEAVVEDGVTRIGQRALQAADNLWKLTLRGDVTIGDRAFHQSKLTSILGQEHIVEIEGRAFKGLNMETIDIRNATAIGTYAFEASKLKTVTLGEGLTVIGNQAFVNGNMCKLYIPDGTRLEAYALWKMGQNDVVVRLPSDLTTIPDGALGFEGMIYVDNTTVAKLITEETHPITHPSVAVLNSGAVDFSKDLPTDAFAETTREGSIFGGWYDNEDYTGEAVPTPTAGQTYYAKWIELKTDKVSLEYGSTRTVPTIAGVNLSNWKSSDPTIVSIENNQLKANKVGTTTLTATASTTAGGTGTLIADVEVTPMRITYGPPDQTSDDGRPYIVYALNANGTTPTFSELLGFYPVIAGAEPGTFDPDISREPITLTPSMADTGDVEYCYENDASDNKLWTDTLPTHPTVDAEGNRHSIRVELKLKNPNYAFCTKGTNWEAKDTIILYVTCYEDGMNKVDLYLAGDNTPLETFNDRHEYEYTGEGIVPTERDLTSLYTKGTNTENSITAFTAHFHAVEEGTAFRGTHLYNKTNSQLTADALKKIAPTELGVYSFVINGYNETTKTYCYASRRYRIVKGTPKGEPTFEKASSGVALSTVTLSGSMKNAAGAEVEGIFTWDNGDNQTVERGKSYTWTFKPGDTDHYNTVTGTAVVWPASSGGGSGSSNVNGSGDDVSISASGGSVTASQMESAVKKADEGAAITIKSTSSTTVTLPVGGMEKAADNDNDVRLDLRYGEITLSARAIAGMTDGISSNDKIKISITSQTSSKDETISDLLDKGAAVFDVSVTVNDVEVHSFDGALTITLTVSNLSKITDPHILHILTSGTKEYYAPDSISGNTITVKGIRNLSTFAVIPGSEVPEEQTNPFTDVYESDYYYDAVLWAVANGVTNGTSATTFGPNVTVTRAQMVTFLWRAHGSPEATGANPFTDVYESDYYYDAVQWAVANGVTTGTSATTFSPDAPVTRAQAVTFQWRAAGSLVVSGSSFDDVAADAYYVNAVTWAVANGITNGTGGNNFSPDAAVSRAQAVTFLYREQE